MALCNCQSLLIILVSITIIVLTEKSNAQLPGEGVILSPPVTQLVTSGENVIFNCYARGNRVEWIINGSVATSPYTSYTSKGITFSRVRYPAADPNRELDRWNMTINVLASTALNNNTRIQCSAFGWIQGQSDNVLAHLIIASPPNTPDVQIQNSTSGHALNITWQRPFTHEGYDITHYSLMVENETSGEARNFIIPPNNDILQQVIQRETDEVSYNFCDELVFTLKAHNTLGESEAATFILAFPIVPQEMNESQIHTTPRIDAGGSLHLDINFQAPNICSFQTANYTIVILHNGQVAVRLNPRTYRAMETSQRVEITQGLETNRNYTLQITVITELGQTLPAYHHFSTEFTLVRPNTEDVSEDDSEPKGVKELVVITGASLGVALLVCVIVIGVVIFLVALVCACRRSKRNKSIDTESPQKLPQTKDKKHKKAKPKSLPPMAHNPIYEGAIYDSPGGDSLKGLLSSSATTPVAESPRYFIDNKPPRLPPPRKSSISSPLPQISESELEQIRFNFDLAVPPGDAEYTIMNPIHKPHAKLSGAQKKATISSPSCTGGKQPEDEYVTINDCK